MITISKEDYLKAIAEAEGQTVIPATLSHWLSVTRPAVTFALKRLTKDGLVSVKRDGRIALTAEGRQIAERTMVLAHDRRRIVHCNVTAHPTAEWTGQQLREAFPFDQLPRYLLHDRDAIFGTDFRDQVRDMGIREVLSTPRSPWQRAYVERVIGSIRRECLDHIIVFHESSLRRILASYLDYYHRSRTHLSLGKDSPEPRSIQPPEMGSVVALPQVRGLHHRYERRAA